MTEKLTISCKTNSLLEIRKFVGSILLKNALTEVQVHKIVLAVDEICANLIIHANKCNPKHKLLLAIEVVPHRKIIFTIKDKGMVFDFTKYEEPSLDEIISTRQKGGLGLILVRRIMDKIEFTTEKNCNICTLIKNI